MFSSSSSSLWSFISWSPENCFCNRSLLDSLKRLLFELFSRRDFFFLPSSLDSLWSFLCSSFSGGVSGCSFTITFFFELIFGFGGIGLSSFFGWLLLVSVRGTVSTFEGGFSIWFLGGFVSLLVSEEDLGGSSFFISIFWESSFFGSSVLNSSFFEVFVLCADYFNGNQRDFADNILLVLEVDEQRRTISYDLFSKYYLYFRCYDLVTNEQKFNFVKKLLNLVYGKEIFMKKQLSNLQIEIRTILNIDELTMKFFTKKLIFSNSVEINKGYNKIDLIYLNMINYFTYQH